jgi:hypothetical protein
VSPDTEQLTISAYIRYGMAELHAMRDTAERTIALVKERRPAPIASAVT